MLLRHHTGMDPGFCERGVVSTSTKSVTLKGVLGHAPPENCENVDCKIRQFLHLKLFMGGDGLQCSTLPLDLPLSWWLYS